MWDAAPHGQLSTGGVHATFGTPRPAPPGNTGVLRVTSAAGAKFGFKAANLTLPIDPACATAACERSSITVADGSSKGSSASVNGAAARAAGGAALAAVGLAALFIA